MIEKMRKIRDLSNKDPKVEIWLAVNENDDYEVLLVVHFDNSKRVKKYEMLFIVDAKKGEIKTAYERAPYPFLVAKAFHTTITDVQKILMSRSYARRESQK